MTRCVTNPLVLLITSVIINKALLLERGCNLCYISVSDVLKRNQYSLSLIEKANIEPPTSNVEW